MNTNLSLNRALSRGRSATLIVAASNANARSKRGADYVCDGTADEVEINAAIMALGSVGGKVLLTEGTFNLNTAINITTSNVVLSGMGHNTLLKITGVGVNGIYIHNETNPDAVIQSIIIEKLKIDGNKANQSGTSHGIYIYTGVQYCFFDKLWITNCKTDGINILGGSGNLLMCSCNTITQCKINNCDHDLIHIESSHMTTISNCPTLDTAGNDGIYMGGDSASNSFRVTDVRITNISGKGVSLYNTSNGHMNKVNVASAAICMQLVASGNNSFSQCYFENPNTQGVYLVTHSDFNVFSGCMFPFGRQILVDFNNCHYNRFIGCNIESGSQTTTNTHPNIKLRSGSSYNKFQACKLFNRATESSKFPTYAVKEEDTANYNKIVDCDFDATKYGTGIVSLVGVNTIIKECNGYVTSSKGTATVADDATYVDVTHGLSKTPVAQEIVVTPTNNLGDASFYWISDVGASTFRINVDGDPGAGTATFAWQIN